MFWSLNEDGFPLRLVFIIGNAVGKTFEGRGLKVE